MYANQQFYNWAQSLGPHYHIPTWIHPSVTGMNSYSSYSRKVPAIDTTKFKNSANRTASYLTEALRIANQISTSQNLARQIMAASEFNNLSEVNRLLLSTGIRIAPSIYYDPEGIRLVFADKQTSPPCCEVGVVIRWN